MSTPKRIQLRRTKGWRKPEGAIVVARPSKWGNPYALGKAQVRMPALDDGEWEHEGRLYKTSGERHMFVSHIDGKDVITWHQVENATAAQCVALYRERITGGGRLTRYRSPDLTATIRAELAGRDLACWCPLDQPCHADVLLEIANGGAS
jgi:hypothetical protein